MSKDRDRRVMMVTLEPVAKTMAGPAIRCLELAKQLAGEFSVTLASPVKIEAGQNLEPPEVNGELSIRTGLGKTELYNLAAASEVLVIQSNVLRPFPRLAELNKYLVIDLYDPYLFAVLVQYKDNEVAGAASYRLMHQVLESHMVNCDFSMCASEIQRDYWLGRYCALGRLTPEMYRFDPSLRKLIDVVPFGLQEKEPVSTAAAMRGRIDPIGEDDKILLWGGGIWDWFDPLTVIKAVDQAKEEIGNLRLFFMGWKSPNPKVAVMDMAVKARALADQLGLTGRHVFFGDDWVPYEKRVNYLLEADIAVSAHFDLPETRFSFRTRMLDYLWAGLPVVSTGGDPLSDQIDRAKAGLALPYEDVDAWSSAIKRLCLEEQLRKDCSTASKQLAERYRWKETSRSLVNYCRSPYHLPEHSRVTMPSLLERAHAVYSRGGSELVLKRSKEIINDLFQ